MNYDFLSQFPRRMKTVGMYAVLLSGSMQRTTWKNFGIDSYEEQANMIFVVLLFIMENSLREINCTMDDIAAFLDTVDARYFHRRLTYEQSHALADFIVGTILSNDGRPQSFKGYSFEEKQYKDIPESYIANRIVYDEKGNKRTSYYLTDDGYTLVLGTLEIENNMKLSIHEMIFEMQLQKQNYDEALEEIRRVFVQLRVQQQKILEAQQRIRRNALNYTVEEYDTLLTENIQTIQDSRKRYEGYRKQVQEKAAAFTGERVKAERLSEQDAHALSVLQQIAGYLDRAMDEYQKILEEHMDLKDLYTQELENLSEMTLVSRYPFRQEIYDRILDDPTRLLYFDQLLSPLFVKDPSKGFNLNLLLRPQKALTQEGEEEGVALDMDFDPEQWEKEEQERIRQKLLRYEKSLALLLQQTARKGSITLKELQESLTKEQQDTLIPDTLVFKEIMTELMKNPVIDLAALHKEEQEELQEEPQEFHLGAMLLRIIEQEESLQNIHYIRTLRRKDDKPVVFQQVRREDGTPATIRCTNVQITLYE